MAIAFFLGAKLLQRKMMSISQPVVHRVWFVPLLACAVLFVDPEAAAFRGRNVINDEVDGNRE